jgi:hypothetical protein
MDSAPRKWNCSHCGRVNRSAVNSESLDTCSYCLRPTVVRAVVEGNAPEEWAEALVGRAGESGAN